MLYRRARRNCCGLMSAFAFMPPIPFPLARPAMPDLAMPMDSPYPAYGLMESSGSGLVDIEDLKHGFLDGVKEYGLVLDGVIAASKAQAGNLWLFRDDMNEWQTRRGPHLRTDVSVPLSRPLLSFHRQRRQSLSVCLTAFASPMVISVTAAYILTCCRQRGFRTRKFRDAFARQREPSRRSR